MIAALEIVGTILSVVGAVLNALHYRCSFHIWILANVVMSYVCYEKGLLWVSAMFVIYFFISIIGLYRWPKKKS
jgi:nicotinamide riboside transporter PnuC